MKLIETKKRTAISFCILVFLVTALIIILSHGKYAGAYFGESNKKFPIHNVFTEKKFLALTFDVEYGNDKSEGILEILKEFDADATFFLTGQWAENYKGKARLISKNFEVGTHSDTHPHLTRITYDECTADLKKSIEKIEGITGKSVTLFRAPYGEYNNKVISGAESLGLQTIQWDVDSFDWKHISSADITKRVLEKASRGSIVLFHSNSENILSFLPAVLQTFKDRGYAFKRVSDLIYKDNYKIDEKGTQRPLAK